MAILEDSFFSIVDYTTFDNNRAIYIVAFNPMHTIFAAHFPGNAIVPGACCLEIIRSLLSKQLGKTLCVEGIKNLKFASMMKPDKEYDVTLEYQPQPPAHYTAKARVTEHGGDEIAIKINLLLTTTQL